MLPGWLLVISARKEAFARPEGGLWARGFLEAPAFLESGDALSPSVLQN